MSTGKRLGDIMFPGTQPQGQPTPDQVTRVGKNVRLGPPGTNGLMSDTIEAQSSSPLVNTWTIVIQPSYATLRLLALGEPFAVKMTVQLHHDSANSIVLYRDMFSPDPLPIALVGQAIGVHGQQIRVGLTRVDEDATRAIDVEVAIIPGPPGAGNIIKGAYSIGGLSPSVLLNIPTMSRHVTVCTALSAGDLLEWIAPNGVGIVGAIYMSDPLLGVKLPIVDSAAYIKYTTTSGVTKHVIFDFETWE